MFQSSIGVKLHSPKDNVAQTSIKPTMSNGVPTFGVQAHVYTLSNAEKDEVAAAMRHFKALGLDGDEISPDVFPLPKLGNVLRVLAEDLHNGRGYFVLRGLSPRGMTSEDTILRYLGISSYVADKIGIQNDQGEVFAHVREAKYSSSSQEERPIRDSTLASTFHTDQACDIVAMHTSGLAETGGNHIVASSAAVYEILIQNSPSVVTTLMEPIWHFDTRGLLAQVEARPILYHHQGRPIFNFNRPALEGVRNIEPLYAKQALSNSQLEALEALEAAARSVQIPLEAELGDITYVNNFSMLHARDGFQDSESSTRHLVRMWLKNSEHAYDLPSQLTELNQRLFDQNRRRSWNLMPKARLYFTVAEIMAP